MTNFPKRGDDEKISLRNSQHPQFDRAFAESLRENDPEIWRAGGNIRGNEAFTLWGRARDGEETEGVLSWIREREAWAARHLGDGSQFPGDSPTLSNIAGVVAAIKWGVVLKIGESAMKSAINELRKNREDRMAFVDTTESRHLIGIQETEEGYVLTFAKNMGVHGPPTSDETAPEGFDGDGGFGGGDVGGDPGPSGSSTPSGGKQPVNAQPTPVKEPLAKSESRNEVSPAVQKSLENKVEEHNEGDPKHTTNLRTLVAVFKRGVGAYKTNPSSVRPSVNSPEQWAHARVNSFLYALKNERFRSGQHDTDLLPESHPLHTEGEQKSENMESIERRYLTPDTKSIEIRYHEDGHEPRVEGYAAVFESPTTIQSRNGVFEEKIARSAFEGRLDDPVVALFNHDQLRPLAKVGAGLELSVDDHGLRYSFPIPDTTTGRDLIELMERGIVREASFAFTIAPGGEEWSRGEGDMERRTITKVGRLIDVSVVTLGAYSDASAALRSLDASASQPEPAQTKTPDEGEAPRVNIQTTRERLRRARISSILPK